MKLAALVLAAILAPAAAFAADLTIVSPDGAAKVLTQADLTSLPRASVQVGAKTYEGPILSYVLRAGGMPVGAKLHGDPLRAYVVVSGGDGFKAVYSLAELDRDFHSDTVILADHVDGAVLPAKETPWRIASSGDKKAWRSVYGITRIEAKIVP